MVVFTCFLFKDSRKSEIVSEYLVNAQIAMLKIWDFSVDVHE